MNTPSPKKSVKKASAKKAVAKKASVKKAASKKKAAKTLAYQERYQKIAETAYLMAEKQSFKPGNDLSNWLAAETQIDQWIKNEKIKLVD
jgi:hypothetical protein